MSGDSLGRTCCGIALAVVILLSYVAGAAATGSNGTALTASIDGQPLRESSETRPIVLDPRKPSTLHIEVSNDAESSVVGHQVRLVARSIGIKFFSYDYTLASDFVVDARATKAIDVPLDLGSLPGQVLGLLPGEVTLLDGAGATLASEELTIDARGSLKSLYGVVGLALGVITALTFLMAVIALARHRLSPHRMNRGLRFMVPGIGLGLTLVFTLSMLRVFVPQPGRCLRIVVVSALVLFALGFLTPRAPLFDDELPVDSAIRPAPNLP